MRLLIFLFLILVTVAACTRKDRPPADVLSPDEMGQVLIDLSQAEAFVENFHSRDSSNVKDSLITVEMDKILSLHKTDDAKFTKSYKYYKSHPALFKILIDSAYSRVQRFRDSSEFKRPAVRL